MGITSGIPPWLRNMPRKGFYLITELDTGCFPLHPTPKHTIGHVLGSPAPVPTKAGIPLTKMGVSVRGEGRREGWGHGKSKGLAGGWMLGGWAGKVGK